MADGHGLTFVDGTAHQLMRESYPIMLSSQLKYKESPMHNTALRVVLEHGIDCGKTLMGSGGAADCDTLPHGEYHATKRCLGFTLIAGWSNRGSCNHESRHGVMSDRMINELAQVTCEWSPLHHTHSNNLSAEAINDCCDFLPPCGFPSNGRTTVEVLVTNGVHFD